MARLFEWLSLAALVCLICLGTVRAIGLHARGVRVVVVDRGRSLAQALRDLLLVLLLLVWAYEIVAIACGWKLHLFPVTLEVALFESVALNWVGVGALAAGLAVYTLALRALGDSWRLGIDRSAPGALVEHGIFAWSRYPIYLGLDLLVLGTFLAQGRLMFLGLAFVIVAMLHDQVLREERFLRRTYGTTYRDYAARVGRYGSLGRLRS
jgi:protein-S-isoprenylcysteine O-methyltransferase Ste14